MSFFPFLQAGPSTTASLVGTLIPFVLIIVIFYFFLIRPQNKKQKETERMLNALKKGDRIVTIGGIHGTIASVKEQTVVVKVDDGCKIEFNRSAVATVELSDAEKAKLEEEAKAKKSEKKNKKASKESVEESQDKKNDSPAEKADTESSEEKINRSK